MPRTGNDRPPGTLNGRCASGRFDAQHHDRRADDDEREQRADAGHLADDLNRRERRRPARRSTQVMIVVMYGVPNLRVDLADAGRQQAVAAHREEDARLAHEHDEQHGGDAGDRAGRDQAGGPVLADDRQRVAPPARSGTDASGLCTSARTGSDRPASTTMPVSTADADRGPCR